MELLKDLGMKFPTEKSKRKNRFGLYKCDCGNEFTVQITSIKNGYTKSCGCLHVKSTKERFTKHGYYNTRLHKIWIKLRNRCNNKSNDCYTNYGARGISVCKEWDDFKVFYDWAMSNGYNKKLSIDRIDNDKNYCPTNCRWANDFTQNANQRRIKKNNTTGVKGITKFTHCDLYFSRITVQKQTIQLGTYKCKYQAALDRDKYIQDNNLPHTKNFERIKI